RRRGGVTAALAAGGRRRHRPGGAGHPARCLPAHRAGSLRPQGLTVSTTADVLLADGSTVHVRPIRPEDADAIVALHSRFSERTRYLRFFPPYPSTPPPALDRLVRGDHPTGARSV